jgi:hypothetical protein
MQVQKIHLEKFEEPKTNAPKRSLSTKIQIQTKVED